MNNATEQWTSNQKLKDIIKNITKECAIRKIYKKS